MTRKEREQLVDFIKAVANIQLTVLDADSDPADVAKAITKAQEAEEAFVNAE